MTSHCQHSCCEACLQLWAWKMDCFFLHLVFLPTRGEGLICVRLSAVWLQWPQKRSILSRTCRSKGTSSLMQSKGSKDFCSNPKSFTEISCTGPQRYRRRSLPTATVGNEMEGMPRNSDLTGFSGSHPGIAERLSTISLRIRRHQRI